MKLRALSVTEITQYIKRNLSLDPILSNVIVEGELSNYKLHSSGHAYFNLKDQGAKIPCVMFHRAFKTLDFDPENGMKLKAKGNVSVYERDGRYQLYVNHMEQAGLGDLHIKFEKLKSTLSEEGLFDLDRKKEVPRFPRHIAVVTSPTGAAIRDILHVLQRRVSYADITIWPVRVQGATSAQEVARAIEGINEAGEADVIILSRGGGSIEELWSFNEEGTARAVADSRVPIITGVGHETDTTMVDFISDLRAPTPSAAAEVVAMADHEIDDKLMILRSRMTGVMESKLTAQRNRLDRVSPETLTKRLIQKADDRRMALDHLQVRMVRAMDVQSQGQRKRLMALGQMLDQVSPLAVMERGYGIPKQETGEVIDTIKKVKEGDTIAVDLRDGTMHCTVNQTEKGAEPWQRKRRSKKS